MHLSKVDMVFRLLSLNQAYVTNSGKVVGVVTRQLLRDYLGEWMLCVLLMWAIEWCNFELFCKLIFILN